MKVASASFTPMKYSWHSFLLEDESTPGPLVRPERLCQWKYPVTPSGIEPATFRFVSHQKHTSFNSCNEWNNTSTETVSFLEAFRTSCVPFNFICQIEWIVLYSQYRAPRSTYWTLDMKQNAVHLWHLFLVTEISSFVFVDGCKSTYVHMWHTKSINQKWVLNK
jgi:hypothetical protein